MLSSPKARNNSYPFVILLRFVVRRIEEKGKKNKTKNLAGAFPESFTLLRLSPARCSNHPSTPHTRAQHNKEWVRHCQSCLVTGRWGCWCWVWTLPVKRVSLSHCSLLYLRSLLHGNELIYLGILYKLKLGQGLNTIPTVGFNVETVTFKKVKFNVWVCNLRPYI